MNFRQLIKHFSLQCVVLTVLVFITFCDWEIAEMNVVVFGTFLYLPYVFLLSGLNTVLIGLGLKIIRKQPFIFLTAIFTNFFFIVWFILSGGQVIVRYWEFSPLEFITLNFVIAILNLFTVYRVRIRKNVMT